MDEAESAQSPNEAYYQLSPFGFLNDSYFTQPQYNPYASQQAGSSARLGLGTEYSGAADFTAPIAPFQVPAGYQTYQPREPMDPNLLSAESYQENTYENMNPGRRQGGSTQLYGGFLASSSSHGGGASSPPATNMRTRRTSKKENPKGSATEESSVRQRGRPRLDTRDQTAAERRRTQIRLAQRAYRQRKETTISGLDKRVSSLEATIEDMHKTFLAFNDKAIASGIQTGNPVLAKHLNSAAERLADLAKNSVHQSDAEDEEPEANLSAQVAEGHERRQRDDRRTGERSGSDHVPMLGYQTTFDEEDDDDGEIARQVPASQAQLDSLPLSDWTATESLQQFPLEIPTSDAIGQLQQIDSAPGTLAIPDFDANDILQYSAQIPEIGADHDFQPLSNLFSMEKQPQGNLAPPGKTLYDLITVQSPLSYSFQEASFARRLLRTSLEASYRLMTNPHSRPEDIKRLCKFTWCFTNSPRIVDHIKGLMERTAKQNLELWEVPAMHVGGAGLHYPRVGIDAGGAPPKWWANQAPVGPLRPWQPETPVPDAMMIGQIVERVGFDGEWFDSNDVEQYLRSKGLYLDGQSSIVELDDVDESLPSFNDIQGPSATSPSASSQDSLRGPQSPGNAESDYPSDPFLQGTDYVWNEDLAKMPEIPDLGMDFSYGETVSLDPHAFYPKSAESNTLPDALPSFNIKIKKFVDIDKFLNTIVKSAVCLGRTPGFRRAAVDSALTLATTEHF